MKRPSTKGSLHVPHDGGPPPAPGVESFFSVLGVFGITFLLIVRRILGGEAGFLLRPVVTSYLCLPRRNRTRSLNFFKRQTMCARG